ncbi:hypothetical protein BX666DRAFT_1838740, partial [Dichotomocladium elegans]
SLNGALQGRVDSLPPLNQPKHQPSQQQQQQQQQRWPCPTTPDQVQQLCKSVTSSHDAQRQIELCVQLMQQASQLNASAGSSSTLELDKAILRDALQTHTRHMLRRLARREGPRAMDSDASHAAVEAQFLLGSCVGQGALGFRKNAFKALEWYVQAAKQNHRESNFRAGICHEYGIGVRIADPARAVAFFHKGARLAHAPCMYRLGVILLRGRCKQPRQPRTAVCWLQRAVAENDRLPYALHALAMVQLSGECSATSLVPDTTYALQLLHKAAQMGYGPSQSKLGEYYETGQFVDRPDDVKSIYWYTCAAEQGCPHAALGLSGWYLTGSTTPGLLPQSDRESFLWAQRAANTTLEPRDYYTGTKVIRQHIANACFTMAHYLERGIGVSAPRQDEATLWYQKAAALGHQQAANYLERRKQNTSNN